MLFKVYKLECLSCNNLNHSEDVSRTKRMLKDTKRTGRQWNVRLRYRLLDAFESRRRPECFLSGTLW